MKNKLIGGIILVVVLILVIVGLNKKSSVSAASLKIGVIDVLSGDKASFGENFKKGIDLAKEEYAATHPGSKVELIYKDDAYDAKKGTQAFHDLINTDHVDALIVATTPTMEAITPEASKLTIPVLGYGQGSAKDKKDSIFRLFPDPSFGGAALGLVLKSFAGSAPQSVVGVYTYDPKTVDLYNAFEQSFGSDLTEFALDPGMEGDATKIKEIAQKVAAKNPKYIFMTNYATLGSQFIKQYQALGKKPVFVFDFTLNNVISEYQKTLGNLNVLDGSLAVSTPVVDAKDFATAYQKKYSQAPGELSDYGYDAFDLLLNTRNGEGTWLDRIGAVKMKGVTGEFNFDETGRRIPKISVVTITNGQIPAGK